MQPNVESLIEAARRLPPADRRRLAEALADSRSSGSSAHRITEIRGVGKDLWKGIDAQKYVDSERDSWED
jgi:hypothetical protein